MSLLIDCPSGHRLKVPRKRAGHSVRCPVCDQAVFVPRREPVTGQKESVSHPSSAVTKLPTIVAATHARLIAGDAMTAAETRQDRERRWSVAWLGVATLGLAALSAVPAMRELFDSVAGNAARQADGWSHLVLLLALIQTAVALLSMQVPDWSTSWIVAVAATLTAAFYAAGLAFCMFASESNALLQRLGLSDEAFHGTAQRWCFLVLCVGVILAYCHGRFSLRWHRGDLRLWQSRM